MGANDARPNHEEDYVHGQKHAVDDYPRCITLELLGCNASTANTWPMITKFMIKQF
jgi:hypothetical protein